LNRKWLAFFDLNRAAIQGIAVLLLPAHNHADLIASDDAKLLVCFAFIVFMAVGIDIADLSFRSLSSGSRLPT
jgi:hypothetical protein